MITIDIIKKYDWESKLVQADKRSCMNYSSIFFSQAKECEKSGDQNGNDVYRLLGDITSMHIDNDDPNNPFKPQVVMNGKRSALLDDFNEEILAIISELIIVTTNTVIKARFADILWVAQNKYKAAQIASEEYLNNFMSIDVSKEWVYHINALERGFFLAGVLGRNKELFLKYVSFCEGLIDSIASDEKTACCVRFLELLHKQRAGNFNKMAITAEQIADNNNASGNGFLVRQYYEISSRLYRLSKKEEESQKVLIKKGYSFVTEAEAVVGRPGQGYIAAVHFLANAIECLRQNNAPKEKIDELHKKLREWQQLSLAEMKGFGQNVDISEIVKSVSNGVCGKNLLDAIFYLALGHPLINKKELRQTTEENIKKYPIQHLFKHTTLAKDGRVVAEKPSILNATPDVAEDVFEAEMFSQLSRVIWPMRVQCFIDTCRVIVRDEHRPSLRDLEFLVYNNPFIPPGHEEIYLKGIHSGFYGNLDLCAHYLTPQIEESIRYVLRQNGIVTSKLDSKLIQEERRLGTLLSMPETVDIFGDGLVFELRGLLCEKHGCDLRNRLAHGFIDYKECFNYDVLLLWWLVIRLCAYPIYMATKSTSEEIKP
jgi:hypothetical protein